MNPTTRPLRTRRAVAAAGAAALVIAAVAAGVAPASAAKGSGGPKGSASPAPATLVLDQAAPSLGDTVTFTASNTGNLRNPREQVSCYQAGVLVWSTSAASGSAFLLGGGWSDWLANGGGAYCVADLYDLTWSAGSQKATFVASTAFEASA